MMCISDYIPFTHSREHDGDVRVDFKAIAQTLLVSAIIGLAIMYSDQSKIIERLDSMGGDIEEIRKNQRRFQGDFYKPMHYQDK